MKWLARLLRKTAEKLDKPAADEQYYARPLAGGWTDAQVRGENLRKTAGMGDEDGGSVDENFIARYGKDG